MTDWQAIDLNDPQWDEPARAPDLHQFLYSGLRHVLSGPPEATKTLIAYDGLLRLAKDGHNVSIVDFEMGPRRAKLMLGELGATPDDLARILFIAPESPPVGALDMVIAWNPAIVLLDASAGAYLASALDDNARKDAEIFARVWIRPLWVAGIATLVIDHVTKNAEGRGAFAIGSERKVGQADVHIGLTVGDKKALTRGGHATAEATVHKDRPGFLRRPVCFYIDIASDPLTHALTVAYRAPEAMPTTEKGEQRPTIKMDQVSRWLEKRDGEPASKKAIVDGVGGNAQAAHQAIAILVREGYCTETEGARGAHLISLQHPYDKTQDQARIPTSSDLFPTSSENRSPDDATRPVPTSSAPFKGAEVDRTGRGARAEDENSTYSDENTGTGHNGTEPDQQDREMIAYLESIATSTAAEFDDPDW